MAEAKKRERNFERSYSDKTGDILVGVGNAALKAEGGTIEKALEKMEEAKAALQDGTFKFRAASGDGGLSTEEEQAIIIDSIVSLMGLSKEDATEHVNRIYAETTKNAKGYIVRKTYNQLKAVPDIKVALAKASKADNNLADLLKVKPAAAPATPAAPQ
jgi:hypothetical protein